VVVVDCGRCVFFERGVIYPPVGGCRKHNFSTHQNAAPCKDFKGGDKVPKIELPESDFPPFLNAKIIGKQKTAIITSPHRILSSTNQPVINVRVGKQEYSFSLNKTNTRRLVEMFGDNSDNWVNKKIVIYTILTTSPKTGKEVQGLRIKENSA